MIVTAKQLYNQLQAIASIKSKKERRENMGKLYTCFDIANRYGVPVETVWFWIRKKQLSAIKIGKSYRVSEEDINYFENQRRTILQSKSE